PLSDQTPSPAATSLASTRRRSFLPFRDSLTLALPRRVVDSRTKPASTHAPQDPFARAQRTHARGCSSLQHNESFQVSTLTETRRKPRPSFRRETAALRDCCMRENTCHCAARLPCDTRRWLRPSLRFVQKSFRGCRSRRDRTNPSSRSVVIPSALQFCGQWKQATPRVSVVSECDRKESRPHGSDRAGSQPDRSYCRRPARRHSGSQSVGGLGRR